MKIKLLLTGGTIDKQYDEVKAELVFGDTHINEMLSQARSTVDIDIEKLMLLDSLDIGSKERQQILDACQASEQDKIVITHGTSTLIETAELLGKNLKGKTVILVGAMIPYLIKNTDALFNLGAAITAVQILGEGVFVTMNGKVLSWDNINKNKELWEFEAKDTHES